MGECGRRGDGLREHVRLQRRGDMLIFTVKVVNKIGDRKNPFLTRQGVKAAAPVHDKQDVAGCDN